MIGTELSYASEDDQPIQVKMDLGSNEHISAFPVSMDGWESSDYNTTRLAKSLDAGAMLMRSYIQQDTFQSVFFLIMHSNNRSSFHPPTICYPSLGYTIVEEGKECVTVKNASWVEKPLYQIWEDQADELGIFNGTITVKKLIVTKGSGGMVTERRVVLYFYVKDGFSSSATVTMIRVSAVAPTSGSYDETMSACKEFMGETVQYIFEMKHKEDSIAVSLIRSGLGGWCLIVVLFAIPTLIMFYPQIKRKIT